VVDSILSPDETILKALSSWAKEQLPQPTPARLIRLVLDPVASRVESRTGLTTAPELPRFARRRSGEDARDLYTLESGRPEDGGAFNTLTRHDLTQGTSRHAAAGQGRVLGEAVFVLHPGRHREDRD
jgi:carotenoid cleavage dioxygenase-like enzyme